MTTTVLLRAYNNDPALKDQVLEKIRVHQEADRIIQGRYWRANGDGVYRGCAVGCLLEDPNGGHERYETEFGIPVQLAWLEDGIFEALDFKVARGWPLRFMAAIPVGADLATVWPRFAIWMLTDPVWGLEQTTEAADVKEVCRKVADGYRQILAGGISDEDAEAITDAARAARAAWAAWAAWDARAAWAAWDARAARAARAARDAQDAQDARDAWDAWDARDAWDAWDAWDARDAWDAWAARAARAARDARDAFVVASADQLIQLLETSTTDQEGATA